MIGTKAAIDCEHLLEAANHKRAEKQNHDGDGDLSSNEHSLALTVGSRTAAISRTQRFRQSRRRLPDRDESEESSGYRAHTQCEQQHRNIDLDGRNERSIKAG